MISDDIICKMKKRKGNPRIIVTFEKNRYEQLKRFCEERGNTDGGGQFGAVLNSS